MEEKELNISPLLIGYEFGVLHSLALAFYFTAITIKQDKKFAIQIIKTFETINLIRQSAATVKAECWEKLAKLNPHFGLHRKYIKKLILLEILNEEQAKEIIDTLPESLYELSSPQSKE